MRIRELRAMLESALTAEATLVQGLLGSENPQVVQTRRAAQSRKDLLEDILKALDGEPTLLHIRGESR